MRILIIEDAEKAASFLKKGLTEKGYVVDVEHDGLEGFIQAQNNNYDIILLDVMLPNMDGWSILEKLKEIKTKHANIIMLTSKDHTDNIVKGLNLGADDYLTKPFTFTELVARIKAITRRKKTKKNNILVFHDLEINLNNQKVTRNGNVIDLAPKEFELLSLLAQNNKIVLSRHEILEKIWDIHFNMQKNLVEMQIKRLRSKIDDGFEKKLIKTVRGIGYMFDGG